MWNEELKDTIRKGACIMIGNGESTRIWQDPWIPGMTNFRPQPAAGMNTGDNALVSDLMLHQPRRWNVDLLSRYFNRTTVKEILKIQLPMEEAQDEWIWTPNRTGKHTVKSFYLLDKKDTFPSQNSLVWNHIWKIKIHERLKIHLWRFASETLPWFSKEDDQCPLCQTNVDKYTHLFSDCIFIRTGWRESPWAIWNSFLPTTSPLELVGFLCNPPDYFTGGLIRKDEFTLYGALLLKNIWDLRNRVLHKGFKPDLHSFLQKIKKDYKEHISLHSDVSYDVDFLPFDGRDSQVLRDNNTTCIYTDIARNEEQVCLAGIAMMKDEVIFSWIQKEEVMSPLLAEARAILLAVSIALQMNWKKTVFYSDALLVVDALFSKADIPWEIKHVIPRINQLLESFDYSKCFWVNRRENLLAHNLSKAGLLLVEDGLHVFEKYPLYCNISFS